MKVDLYNQNAEKVGVEEIPDKIFNLKINKDLLHQVIVAYQSNKKKVAAHTKTRGEVRGGGRKPWRQKGTGRARHGSIRSPLWRGGGIVFGPTNKLNFKKKINKKIKRKAILMALSSKAKDSEMLLIDDLKLDIAKTKKMISILNGLIGVLNPKIVKNKKRTKLSVLIIIPDKDEILFRASNNIPKVLITTAKNINALDILSYKYLILLKDSIDVIEKTFVK